MKPGDGKSGHDPTSLSEQAARWWVLLKEDTCAADDRQAFAAWVRRSPEHVDAFLRVSMLRKALRSPQIKWPDTSAEELIQQSRDASAEVIPLGRSMSQASMRPPILSTFRSARMLLCAGLATLSIAVLATWLAIAPDRYRTGLGEQRSVLLADGSIVTLNTSSEVEVKYSGQRRFMHLVRGEALFNVAHDPSRTFDVATGSAIVRAVGTQFNVDRRADRTTVSVVEGKVQVISEVPQVSQDASRSNEKPAEPVTEIVTAAQRVVLTKSGMSTPEHIPDVMPVTAWTQRQLVFENQSLSEVAAEFNRYNRQHILIQSAELRAQRVTGVFQANDPSALVAFISRIAGTRIETTAEGHYVVSADGASERMDAGEGPNLRR